MEKELAEFQQAMADLREAVEKFLKTMNETQQKTLIRLHDLVEDMKEKNESK